MVSLDQMQARFGIPGAVEINLGNGGLPRVAIRSRSSEAHIYLHGAHVTHFQPFGQEPLLFLSRESVFAAGKPIRGGVPVIFPWFGPKANEPSAPIHGFARVLDWELIRTRAVSDDTVQATFALTASDATRAAWPYNFQ